MKRLLTLIVVISIALVLLGCGSIASEKLSTPFSTARDKSTPSEHSAPLVRSTEFIRTKGDQFMLGSEIFKVLGLNYYPKDYPWQKFWTEFDPAFVSQELDLMKTANINTIRIFIWHEPFFSSGIPDETYFDRLDAFLQLCEDRDLRVIVTLNDLPDVNLLYTDYSRYDPEMQYIVSRYKENPTVLAWDLKNEGDQDYNEGDQDYDAFGRDTVVQWLEHASNLVKTYDPNHLITAGWWQSAEDTIPYVDFVSFHHWLPKTDLLAQIEGLRAATTKPLVMEEFGLHTWPDRPGDPHNEEDQAVFIKEHLEVAAQEDIAGSLIWSAFDFPLQATCHTIMDPDCAMGESFQNHMGIWRADYSAKPAVQAIAQPHSVALPTTCENQSSSLSITIGNPITVTGYVNNVEGNLTGFPTSSVTVELYVHPLNGSNRYWYVQRSREAEVTSDSWNAECHFGIADQDQLPLDYWVFAVAVETGKVDDLPGRKRPPGENFIEAGDESEFKLKLKPYVFQTDDGSISQRFIITRVR
jgi:hypothetical protein